MVSRWVGEKKGKSQNSSKVTPLWVTEGTTEMGKSEYIVIEAQLTVVLVKSSKKSILNIKIKCRMGTKIREELARQTNKTCTVEGN